MTKGLGTMACMPRYKCRAWKIGLKIDMSTAAYAHEEQDVTQPYAPQPSPAASSPSSGPLTASDAQQLNGSPRRTCGMLEDRVMRVAERVEGCFV